MRFQKKKITEEVRGILGKCLDGTEKEFREATERIVNIIKIQHAEKLVLEAQNIVEAYKLQLQQPPVIRSGRWKCMLCGRDKFTRKSPHKCVGGYRKRKIVWQELLYPLRITPVALCQAWKLKN